MRLQEDTVKHILASLSELINRNQQAIDESRIDLENCLPLIESSISFDLSHEMLDAT